MKKTFPSAITQRTFTALQWFAAYLAVHWTARLLIVWTMAETAGSHGADLWLRGALSDIAMATVLAVFAIIVQKAARWLPFAVFFVWCAALAGNREYISEWQSNLSVLDIAGLIEPTFIKGSVLVSHLFYTLAALLAVGLLTLAAAQRKLSYLLPPLALFVSVVVALLTLRLPADPPQLWVQQNLLEENIHQVSHVFTAKRGELPQAVINSARRLMHAKRRQDLNGELIVTQKPRANVIVVNIESLSENSMRRGWMPYLRQLADHHLHYTQYIDPNLTTIRGLYAQVSGQETYLGRFGRDSIAKRITRLNLEPTSLPYLLNQQEYETVFMQSAELGFQDKEHVMANVGFQHVIGDTPEVQGDRYSEWGVDDVSLYRNMGEMIESFEAKRPGQPWMFMLMTAGTHHPYNVPPSFEPDKDLRERGFRYADYAIKTLVEWLKSTGRITNTLLIITGDESREARKSTKGIVQVISRNQGIMVIVTPGNEQRQVDEPFLQSDLALSILDYLNIDAPAGLGGRSLFRSYQDFRPLVFGDYSQSALYAMMKPEELVGCNTEKWKCTSYRLSSGPIFDMDQTFTEKPAPAGLMRAIFEENRIYWFGK